jgi:hypothetical protein
MRQACWLLLALQVALGAQKQLYSEKHLQTCEAWQCDR